MNKLILLILISFIESSCMLKREVRLRDTDIIIHKTLYSPNQTYVVYSYSIDLGAIGNSRGAHAIVKTSEIDGAINKNEFSCLEKPNRACYSIDKWLDDTTLQVKIAQQGFIREGLPVNTTSFKVGDVIVKVIADDPTSGLPADIEHYSVSPDGKKLLVAYRYSGLSDLNVSVISLHEPLPTIGNILSPGEYTTDKILYGAWVNNDEIKLTIKDDAKDYFRQYLNKNLPIKVSIVAEKDIEKYPAIEGGWYNKSLHSSDHQTTVFLEVHSVQSEAIVKNILEWGDTYYTGRCNYFYEYRVNGMKYSSYFRAPKDRLKNGDRIKIIYNKIQPIIHYPIEHNGR